jgi:hypothetical protein
MEPGLLAARGDEFVWIEEFVNCIENSTLTKPGLDEAIALKEAHLPKRVYKFRRDGKYARANLETDTVWMASPDAYNDPYDCSFTVAVEHVVDALKKSLVTEFANVYKLPADVADEQIEKAMSSSEPLMCVAEYVQTNYGVNPEGNPLQAAEFISLRAPSMIENTVGVLRQWRKLTKVCSFSAVNDSILMWGHYAQDHKGFCIEYDLEQLQPEHPFRRKLYPVIYSPKLYDLTAYVQKLVGRNRQEFNPSLPLLGVLHKFDGWKYEQEWRVVSISKTVVDDHDWSVPTPSRVFLGSKMSSENIKAVRKICEQRNIDVLQMELAEDMFQLLPRPIQPHG